MFLGFRRLPVAVALVLALTAGGCASYHGTARDVDPSALDQGQWLRVRSLADVRQHESNDCGAAALAAVLRFWGRPATPETIESALGNHDTRLRAGEMVDYARAQGLHSYVFFGVLGDLVHELERGRPVIVGLGKDYGSGRALAHYEVVAGYAPSRKQILLLDPAKGFQLDELAGFMREWERSKGVTIVTFLPESPARASLD